MSDPTEQAIDLDAVERRCESVGVAIERELAWEAPSPGCGHDPEELAQLVGYARGMIAEVRRLRAERGT